MIDFQPAGVLILSVNAVLVFVSACLLFHRVEGGDGYGVLALVLGLGLFMSAQIIAAGLLSGYLEYLNPYSLLLFHGITCALLYSREKSFSVVGTYLRQIRLRLKTARDTFTLSDWVFAGLLALFSGSALVANLLGELSVHDALSYRLSRIAHWLQEGSIRHFVTNEDRQSYHAINASLFMLWFTAPFSHGYPLVKLPQFVGGVLTLLSTLGIARYCGLNRNCQWGVVALLLMMPNWTSQWMTCHTDLVTAGFMNAGLYFLLLSFRTGRYIFPTWCGIALAVGAKGTVFYWAPGLVAMVMIWAVLFRQRKSFWRRHSLTAIGCLTFLAAPRYFENTVHYGNPFAPEDAITGHHGENPSGGIIEKTGLNGLSSFIQALEPISNPPPLNWLLTPLWRNLIQRLPETDPYSNTFFPRKGALENFGALSSGNADTYSSGIIVVVMALAGSGIALGRYFRNRDRSALLWLSFAVGIGGFLIFFSALFHWWPTSFRYFNLLAPWMAVLGMVPFHLLPSGRMRAGCAILWTVASITLCGVYFRTFNSGWQTLIRSREVPAYLRTYKLQREIVDQFPENSRIGVMLPWNQVLAGFYRNQTGARVRLLKTNALPQFPDASTLREHGLDGLISLPMQPPASNPGVRYFPVGDVASGQMYYLVHVVIK